jgi:hypothetical protein
MTRTSVAAALSWILLSGSSALAAPPPVPPADGGVALKTGDTVEFELTGLPSALEGEGLAVCVGTQNAATGPVEARCERTFKFALPADETRMTFTFRGSNGRETPVELPVLRSSRPVTFVAPSDGSLVPPGSSSFQSDTTDAAARRVAERQCGECRGSGFMLDSVKVTRSPIPAPESMPVKLKITRSVAPAPK